MGLTRADLNGEMTEEERASRQEWIDRTMANEKWTNKLFQKVGVLLTSHQANRPYLKACVESHAKLGLWITLAYDSYVDPEWSELDHNRFMPSKDVLDKIDMFLMPHYQTWGGVLFPYIFLLNFGACAMRQFEYIYCTNGDFILEKPEGFNKLLEMMGDHDVMTCGSDTPGKYANTAGFIIKSKALYDVAWHMRNHMIPYEVYEKHTQAIGNAEGRFGRAIKDLNLRQLIVDPPSDDMLRIPGKGTWYELLGFRHIHAEHNYAYRNRGIPPPIKHLDGRFMGDEYNIIKKFEETQDKAILENWWAKD